MCFDIQKSNPKEKIAKKDIICYKTLERQEKIKKGIFKSVYQNFIYDFNKKTTYKANINKIKVEEDHSWNGSIFEGIHSYISKPNTPIWRTRDCFQCIIPKGTPYYINTDSGEYVSLRIQFVDRLTFVTGRAN